MYNVNFYLDNDDNPIRFNFKPEDYNIGCIISMYKQLSDKITIDPHPWVVVIDPNDKIIVDGLIEFAPV